MKAKLPITKSEFRKKFETRSPKPEWGRSCVSNFGLRCSFGFRSSIFGFLLLLLSALNSPFSSILASPAVTSIAGGYDHTIFSKSDGSLWVMGDNFDGQLGIGFSPAQTNVPQQVLSSGVGAVAAGLQHSLFRMGGSLWVMGYNGHGQLGDGSTANHYFPEKVFTGGATVSVTVMGTGPNSVHSLFGTSGFLTGSTALRGMGDGLVGELGDGTYTNHLTPEIIVSSAVSSIGCGSRHSVFLKSDGSLWSMGDNSFGQLGVGGSLTKTNRPVEVVASGVTAVAAGSGHSLFIKSDGSLWGFGYNGDGELGDNTTGFRQTPEQLAFNGVTAIAAGALHSLYLKSDGSLWGMGANSFGQLGDGTTNDYHVPFRIVASQVVAVAAGDSHSLFIKSDGSLWGMGYNGAGQLGDGSFTNHLTPFQIVAGLPPVPRITGISLAGANLNLTGANGVLGETIFTLMSADLALPLSQWQPVATNVLTANGNFSLTATNAVVPGSSRNFFTLQAQ